MIYYDIVGYPFVFQIWFYECYGYSNDSLCSFSEPKIPHMLIRVLKLSQTSNICALLFSPSLIKRYFLFILLFFWKSFIYILYYILTYNENIITCLLYAEIIVFYAQMVPDL